ncbi:MAG TPA: hypothetical protein DGG95_11005 [Cytophagales bacterium]|jgi:hypothetical protein|nr:hypothetical protein [Cytophagales bacterium]
MENFSEDIFLKSLDVELSLQQKTELENALQNDRQLQKKADQFVKLRTQLQRNEVDSFGPFFAERIINRIKSLKKEIDYQIFFFFKKYQLAVLGVIVALVVLNIFSSDHLTLQSIFGFEEQQVEDLVTIDIYKDLTP